MTAMDDLAAALASENPASVTVVLAEITPEQAYNELIAMFTGTRAELCKQLINAMVGDTARELEAGADESAVMLTLTDVARKQPRLQLAEIVAWCMVLMAQQHIKAKQ